jgi:hypothetical protein
VGGVAVKSLTRRSFFRGARTAVVGGAAFAVIAVVGLPALPKKKIPFIFDKSSVYTIEWRKDYLTTIRTGLPVIRWRELYAGAPWKEERLNHAE